MGERFDYRRHGATPWMELVAKEDQFPRSRVGVILCKDGHVAFGAEVPESGILIEIPIEEIREKLHSRYKNCRPEDVHVLVGFDIEKEEARFEVFVDDCVEIFFRNQDGSLGWFLVQQGE